MTNRIFFLTVYVGAGMKILVGEHGKLANFPRSTKIICHEKSLILGSNYNMRPSRQRPRTEHLPTIPSSNNQNTCQTKLRPSKLLRESIARLYSVIDKILVFFILSASPADNNPDARGSWARLSWRAMQQDEKQPEAEQHQQ